ncbi:MAG: ATP-dependent helicase [Planctomycetota bacterium]
MTGDLFSTTDLLDGLTDSQREAVTHIDGPLLVLAGAGSGKTRVITRRIAYLISQGVPPWSILAITFTNKAAREMAERVEHLGYGGQPWLSTFHGMGARILRREAGVLGYPTEFSIYDRDDSLAVVKQVMADEGVDTDAVPPAKALHVISNEKGRMSPPEQFAKRARDPMGKQLAKIYTGYETVLRANSAMDFDDLLVKLHQLLMRHPEVLEHYRKRFQYVLVDEYQDTNRLQYGIIKKLVETHRNICATGDPDQSIYAWRGADIRNILDFERDYPDARVVRLEENFRSIPSVLRVADALIGQNRKRKSKQLRPTRPEGKPVRYIVCRDEWDEARTVTGEITRATRSGERRPRDFGILYRTNSQSRVLEAALRDTGVPYTIVGAVEFYHRKEVKTLLSYLRLLVNPDDDGAFVRVVNTPTRGIGAVTVGHLREAARELGLPLLKAAHQPPVLEDRKTGKVATFVDIMDRLGNRTGGTVAELVEAAIDITGMREDLESSKDPKAGDRLDNLQELVSAAAEHDARHDDPSLVSFLEEVALVSDVDNLEEDTDRVTLMTLHSAKGLEFPVVFLTGMEEGLLPHSRSSEDADGIEEERRLCYVGFTRAQDELVLTGAMMRSFQGATTVRDASPFIDEIPDTLLEVSRKQVEQMTGGTTPDPWDQSKAHSGRPAYHRRPKLDRESNPNSGGFAGGDLVRHEIFGSGVVLITSGSGDTAKITVAFKRAGTKTLVAKYAKLEKALG